MARPVIQIDEVNYHSTSVGIITNDYNAVKINIRIYSAYFLHYIGETILLFYSS